MDIMLGCMGKGVEYKSQLQEYFREISEEIDENWA
jgi:hypothetical protein